MKDPFIIRVESDDRTLAERIALAMRPTLIERGARAHVVTRAGAPGASVAIAIPDGAYGNLWLAPFGVPAEPSAAAQHVTRFLEEWGFIAARMRAPATHRASGP